VDGARGAEEVLVGISSLIEVELEEKSVCCLP